MSRINISIVLYNNPLSMLEKAIKSVLNTALDITLYLIDNSPTNNLQKLPEMDSRIVYIHNPSNPGFGAAHNIAIAQSIQSEAHYHLVLNPDIYFEMGVLEDITLFMNSNTDVGLVMPKVLYPNGETQFIARLLPTPWDLFARRFIPIKSYLEKLNRRYELTFFNYTSTIEVPFISGCFMFLRTETLKEVGYFDESFFMYLEDADLSRRIGMGSKTVLYPHVSITHEYQRGSHRSFKLLMTFIRSVFIYFNKHGWFFDTYRTKINKRTLKQLGWSES